MAGRADELDDFKTRINLTEYAAAQGYALDRRATSPNSAVMESTEGDKIIVARGHDRHWIFFSVRDERDSGSIVDFVQNRQGGHLGDVRKELRPWLGRSGPRPERPPASAFVSSLKPASRDAIAVRARFEGMAPIDGRHAYLEEERGIPVHVLTDPCFSGRVRRDSYGNAVFPHWNRDGLCGFEIKNHEFTGFAKGGVKGLWASRPRPTDRRLLIAETAIDALSYAAIRGTVGTRFLSIAGQMIRDQPVLVRAAVEKMPADAAVVIAVDNDEAGDELVRRLETALASVERSGLSLTHDRPPSRGADWNDVLRDSATGEPLTPAPPAGNTV